jgi:hypothetical protein
MAIRNEFDDYEFALRRQDGEREKDADPAMKETLVEVAMTLCGIVGLFLLAFVCVRVMGYN